MQYTFKQRPLARPGLPLWGARAGGARRRGRGAPGACARPAAAAPARAREAACPESDAESLWGSLFGTAPSRESDGGPIGLGLGNNLNCKPVIPYLLIIIILTPFCFFIYDDHFVLLWAFTDCQHIQLVVIFIIISYFIVIYIITSHFFLKKSHSL